jgi:nucleoside 2-deoxyribosyltransferase
MPFAEDYVDEFEIAFCEAARASEYICERLDLESFTGDIVTEIKRRILDSNGVIALLNDHNPNVFLEVGFALAHDKPTILVAKTDVKLPFDVSGHRCVRYRSITQLRQTLSTEIAALKAQGVLVKSKYAIRAG